MPTQSRTRASGGAASRQHLLAADLPAPGRAAVTGGVWGNYVDQLNIFLPVTALAPALPTIAGRDAVASTVAFVVMATLIGRPLGAMIFGRISDAVGRTTTTRVAIAGTAACTFGIAAVPPAESIGLLSIGIVIGLRFLGGVFLAGEYTSAIPLAMEWSEPTRRGLASGLIMSMAAWAQGTIALVTVGLLTVLGPDAYAAWGWRASFAAGGTASVLMLIYYTRHVADAPIFRRHPAKTTGAPRLAQVLAGRYAGQFWQVFALMSGLWFLTNMTVIVLTQRMVSDVGLDARGASVAMALASIAQAIVMALAGHLSTRTGRRRFFIGWGLLAVGAGAPLWLWITAGPRPALVAGVGAALLQVVTVCAYGPVGAYINERFPTHVRATGYGTAYSLSIVIPALYPYYLPALERVLGHQGAPAALIVLGALLVAVGGALGPRLSPAEIDDDLEAVAARADVRGGVPAGSVEAGSGRGERADGGAR